MFLGCGRSLRYDTIRNVIAWIIEGTFPDAHIAQTSTERSKVRANAPLLRSRRQMPLRYLSGSFHCRLISQCSQIKISRKSVSASLRTLSFQQNMERTIWVLTRESILPGIIYVILHKMTSWIFISYSYHEGYRHFNFIIIKLNIDIIVLLIYT